VWSGEADGFGGRGFDVEVLVAVGVHVVGCEGHACGGRVGRDAGAADEEGLGVE